MLKQVFVPILAQEVQSQHLIHMRLASAASLSMNMELASADSLSQLQLLIYESFNQYTISWLPGIMVPRMCIKIQVIFAHEVKHRYGESTFFIYKYKLKYSI